MATPAFYNHVLSQAVQSKVSEQLRKLIPEQLGLTEEVAIHRVRCADAVREWSEAKDILDAVENLGVSTPEVAKSIKTARINVDMAAQKMAEVFKFHKDLAKDASDIDHKNKSLLDERTLLLLINTAVQLTHKYFDDGSSIRMQVLDRWEEEFRASVIIDSKDNESLAIEGEFHEMLGSVEGPDSKKMSIVG